MPKDKEPAPPDVEVYFDTRSRDYFFQVNGELRAMASRDLKLFLRSMGHSDSWTGPTFDNLKACEYIMKQAQEKRAVAYAGPLAGYRRGRVKDSFGNGILVTNEPSGIWDKLPKKAPPPKHFFKFLQTLLPDDQCDRFAYWLSVSLRSLRECDFRPGQLVCLAGPSQCGKSLLQQIITEVLGGRVGSPFAYMMGETQFNSELAGAEHWVIEDPQTSTDLRTRRLFGAKLKEATVNKFLKIHPKGKEAITLPVFRRVTLSVNDEPENLAVLPPLDDSVLDKIFAFHCAPAPYGPTPEDRNKTWDLIVSEVPKIRQWLLVGLPKIPKALHDDRFLIKAWQHPDLLRELRDMAPESRLWEMICHALWSKPDLADEVFEGKAIELEERLKQSLSAQEVERLLKSPNACGTYLARLAKRMPNITKRMKEGFVRWTITPPSNPSNPPTS